MRRPMKKSKRVSAKNQKTPAPDYPLQGSSLDTPLSDVLLYSPKQRRSYITKLLNAFGREIKADRMALKRRTPFKKEMKDLRKLLHLPADKYLFTDDNTLKPNVLGKGSPGSTHTYWSRTNMWKMKTKAGDLSEMILTKAPSLISKLEKLFDPKNTSKKNFREKQSTAVQTAISFLQMDKGSGSAFPPFHAKFFADRYLPKDTDGIVVDPCAGWGGRLLGTLSVHRKTRVTYIGVDPEKKNKAAYDGLERRINIWLKRELSGEREAILFYRPFEDWIGSATAKKLFGKVDLVITSPPYFSAENYNPSNKKQSANRYKQYEAWKEKFYRQLVKGAYALLQPGGMFVLNIADVVGATRLERDARTLAKLAGFENAGFYKLALSISPAARKAKNSRHTTIVNGAVFKHEPCFCFRKPTRN